jgi:hypothetical protein
LPYSDPLGRAALLYLQVEGVMEKKLAIMECGGADNFFAGINQDAHHETVRSFWTSDGNSVPLIWGERHRGDAESLLAFCSQRGIEAEVVDVYREDFSGQWTSRVPSKELLKEMGVNPFDVSLEQVRAFCVKKNACSSGMYKLGKARSGITLANLWAEWDDACEMYWFLEALHGQKEVITFMDRYQLTTAIPPQVWAYMIPNPLKLEARSFGQ